MKKCMLLVVLALTCHIVTAQTAVYDATLKVKGVQNEASTIVWLQSENPDRSLINMPLESFYVEFRNAIIQMNAKYRTFPEITDEVMNTIVANLYTKDLDLNKSYRLSWYGEKRWGSWSRKPKIINGEVEKGLFYPGWDEDPLMSVYCWNFGYPTNSIASAPAPAPTPQREIVYQYIPGKTTVIDHGIDTVIINKGKVQIENNNVMTARYNNRYDVVADNTQASYASNNQGRCGCHDTYLCERHYKEAPHKKGFFKTATGKILTYAAAFAAGYFTKALIDKNNPNIVYRTINATPAPTGGIITQGPLTPLGQGSFDLIP